MADFKAMLKDLAVKAVKTQVIDKTAAERVARTIRQAQELAKIQKGKKA